MIIKKAGLQMLLNWKILVVLLGLGYAGFTVTKIYRIVQPPLWNPKLDSDDQKLTNLHVEHSRITLEIFLTDATIHSFSADPAKEPRGAGGRKLRWSRLGMLKGLYEDGSCDNFDSVVVSVDDEVNIIPLKEKKQVNSWLRFRTNIECRVGMKVAIPEMFRKNSTVMLTAVGYSTDSDTRFTHAFSVYSHQISAITLPDSIKPKKALLLPRLTEFLKINKLITIPSQSKNNRHIIHSQPSPISSIPKLVFVGPLFETRPFNLEKTRMALGSNWVVSGIRNSYPENYNVPVIIDSYQSPRDDYLPLEVPETPFELEDESKKPPEFSIIFRSQRYTRFFFMNFLTRSFEAMSSMGASAYDIDSFKMMVAGSHPFLLGLTFFVSLLHIIFEIFAFASDISFYNTTDSASSEKLSIRSVGLDLICSLLILVGFREEDEASKLVMILILGRVLVDAWKVWKLMAKQGEELLKKESKAAKNKNKIKIKSDTDLTEGLKEDEGLRNRTKKNIPNPNEGKVSSEAKPVIAELKLAKKQNRLWFLSKSEVRYRRSILSADDFEFESLKALSVVLVPLLVVLCLYQLLAVPQKGWWAFVAKNMSFIGYTFGFISMTPQLSRNFYFRSVVHLPWNVLCYQFLNTIIDDLFSLLIRMPSAHRVSVFRDDVVFIVYLFQWNWYRRAFSQKKEKVN